MWWRTINSVVFIHWKNTEKSHQSVCAETSFAMIEFFFLLIFLCDDGEHSSEQNKENSSVDKSNENAHKIVKQFRTRWFACYFHHAEKGNKHQQS